MQREIKLRVIRCWRARILKSNEVKSYGIWKLIKKYEKFWWKG